MHIVDLLPEKFVESDFVTRQRLKYEANPKKYSKIYNTIAYTTGAAIGLGIAGTIYVAGYKLGKSINEN